MVPFQGLVSVLSTPLFVLFGRKERRLQPEGLLQPGVEVGPVVDVELKAVDCHVKPGLCLGIWSNKSQTELISMLPLTADSFKKLSLQSETGQSLYNAKY